MRRPLIAGNWKMHKTVAEAMTFVGELLACDLPAGVDVTIAPPFTALAAVGRELRRSPVALAAQTMHEGTHGPFTGEISPVMLRELGVRYVILGHSERRAHCGELDAAIARKVRSALDHRLTPIVAVGETREEHEAERTLERVLGQTHAAFAAVGDEELAGCVVAYEPIWAIGSGLVDEPSSANAVMGAIRGVRPGLRNARILYGGSMKPDNAAGLLAQPEIDGGLIGGASLNAGSFAALVVAAATRIAAR